MSRPRKHTAKRLRPSISIRGETYERLKPVAKARGVSVSALVEERINQFLNRKGIN